MPQNNEFHGSSDPLGSSNDEPSTGDSRMSCCGARRGRRPKPYD